VTTQSGAGRSEGAVTTVASFNLHAGVDGWGRRFDVISACRGLDADVLVLQECFSPVDGPAQTGEIAEALGYTVTEVPLNRGVVLDPFAGERTPSGWGPRPWSGAPRALRYAGPPAGHRGRVRPGELAVRSRRGAWNLAVLARASVRSSEVAELPSLPGDPARRVVVIVELEAGLRVAGTHLGHLTRGSPRQMRELSRLLGESELPTALLGDMNCWGPILLTQLPGFRRAVRGRTWPAWRPHSQIDHILVTRGVEVLGSGVLGPLGSDHRPVRARLRIGA